MFPKNPSSLVLRTDITLREEDQEHNPRSPSGAPVLPPIFSLPSIEVTSPTSPASQTPTTAQLPTFAETTRNDTSVPRIDGADWKAREAGFDSFSDVPQPPPAYSATNPQSAYSTKDTLGATMSTKTTTTPGGLTPRQRRLNLPKINPHARVSSINPAKSPIDVRKWHEKRRNIAFLSGGSLTIFLTALLFLLCYVVPEVNKYRSNSGVQNVHILRGTWNMTNIQLESADNCAAKEGIFDKCSEHRFAQAGAGDAMSFKLTENEDGTFEGDFSAGIFDVQSPTSELLRPSRYGLMTNFWYSYDEPGKLSEDGCAYVRVVQVLATMDGETPIYKISEKQLVEQKGNCILPGGRKEDMCECRFSGTRPKALKKRSRMSLW